MATSPSKNDTMALLGQIITILRGKKRDIVDKYQTSSRALMRSFDFANNLKDDVFPIAQTEYHNRQLKEMIEISARDATYIYQNFNEFLKNIESPPYQERYCRLLSVSAVFGVPQIDQFAQQCQPPKKQLKMAEIKDLGEKEIIPYIKKFAEDKGSSQGAGERLLELCTQKEKKENKKKVADDDA